MALHHRFSPGSARARVDASDRQTRAANLSPALPQGGADKQNKDKMALAVDKYLEAANFQDGPNPGMKARVVFSSVDKKCATAAALRAAARAFSTTEANIPENEIRVSLPVKFPIKEGERRLFDHWSEEGALPLPATTDWAIPPEAKDFVSPVVACAYFKTTRNREQVPTAHIIKVAFASREGFDAALSQPITLHGQLLPMEHAPVSALEHLVEIRFVVPDLRATDNKICESAKAFAGNIAGAELIAVVRSYEYAAVAVNSVHKPIPRPNGHCSAYLRFSEVKRDAEGAFRACLANLLPSSIKYGGEALPARHSFENGLFCPRCRFAGHEKDDCPRHPCRACARPGHIAKNCNDPTGRRRESPVAESGARGYQQRQEFQRVPTRTFGTRPGRATAQNANTIPLGNAPNRFSVLPVEDTLDSDEIHGEVSTASILPFPFRPPVKRRGSVRSSIPADAASPGKKARGGAVFDFSIDTEFPPLPSNTTAAAPQTAPQAVPAATEVQDTASSVTTHQPAAQTQAGLTVSGSGSPRSDASGETGDLVDSEDDAEMQNEIQQQLVSAAGSSESFPKEFAPDPSRASAEALSSRPNTGPLSAESAHV